MLFNETLDEDFNEVNDDHPLGENALFKLLQILVATFGLVGNGLIVFIVLKCPSMQSVTNVQILNLSLFDILILLKPVLFERFKWFFNALTCKSYLTFMTVIEFGSIYQLAALGVDRCLALCFPIRSIRFRTLCYSAMICLTVWTLAILFSAPIAYFGVLHTVNNVTMCSAMWKDYPAYVPKIYEWFQFAFTFVIPGLILIASYVMILIKLSQFRKLETRNSKKLHKVTLFVAFVIGFYLLFWLPYYADKMATVFDYDFGSTIETLVNFITYFHSALHPVLYAFVNTSFRTNIIQIFRRSSGQNGSGDLRTGNASFKREPSESKTQESIVGV